MLERLARLCYRRRRRVLLVWLAALIGFVAVGNMAGGNWATSLRMPRTESQRAFDLLKKQVAFGPRVAGRPSYVACREFLLQSLKQSADQASLQEFTGTFEGKPIPMANLIARWKPKGAGIC